MRQFVLLLLTTLFVFGFIMKDADAKRFGGGRSFGTFRSASSFSRPSGSFTQAYSRNQSPFGQNSFSSNRWLGPLAGLVTGGLLASLFMGHGFGSGILSWLIMGGLFFFIIHFIKNKLLSINRPYAYQPQDNVTHMHAPQTNNHYSPGGNWQTPTGFDEANFLRDAKVLFMRLQTAYDQKNLTDIRQFTTPEVAAEIQIQFQERGDALNETEVTTLNAQLLDASTEAQMISQTEMQASVRFTGLIREDRSVTASSFNEIWHFRKDVGSARWLVTGIQQ